MPKKVLIAYATRSGSTAEVAEAIGHILRESGALVAVLPAHKVLNVTEYDAVVIGGPKVSVWHPKTLKFIRRYRSELERKPSAWFMTTVVLTRETGDRFRDIPLFIDSHAVPPVSEGRLTRWERLTTPSTYLAPILDAIPSARPAAIALFAGDLDYSKLGLVDRLILKFIVRAKAGDFRNWESIRSWASGLKKELSL